MWLVHRTCVHRQYLAVTCGVLIQPKDNLGTRLELCSIMYVKKITLGRTEVRKAKVGN
jgi:hypothetical protein